LSFVMGAVNHQNAAGRWVELVRFHPLSARIAFGEIGMRAQVHYRTYATQRLQA
jgi:hypothetical protein